MSFFFLSFLDPCDYSTWVACFYQINANPLILKNLRSTTNVTKIFPLNKSLSAAKSNIQNLFVLSGGRVEGKQTAYFTP